MLFSSRDLFTHGTSPWGAFDQRAFSIWLKCNLFLNAAVELSGVVGHKTIGRSAVPHVFLFRDGSATGGIVS